MKKNITEQENRPSTVDLVKARDVSKCPFLIGGQLGKGVMMRVAQTDSKYGYYSKGDKLFIKNDWTFDVVKNDKLFKKNLPWKCDSYTQTAGVTQDTTKLTPDQQAMATTITTNDKGWSNTKPVDYDTNPQNYKTKKVGDVIYYKKTAFTNMRPDQITKLDEVLTDKGYTRKAPDYGTPEYEYAKSKPKTLADVLTQYDINEIGITDLTTRIYRLDVTDLGPKKKEDIRKEIKSYKNAPRYTALECKTNIENLYNNSPSTTKKPRKFTPLTDEYAIEEAKNIVMACIAQQGIDGFTVARGYDAGVFGVSTDDQVRQLTRDRGMYGIKSLYDSWRTSQRTSSNEGVEKELKNIIRENLITIQSNKKKVLTEETKIVNNRFKFIAEGKNFKSKKEQQKFVKEMIQEITYLNSQGFDKKVINEGFWDILSGLFPKGMDSVFQYFKEQATEWLLGKLKVDTNGWIGNIIIAAMGDVDIAEIPKLFTDCNFTTKKLSKAIAEGSIRKLQNQTIGDSAVADILRNTMVEVLEETDLGTKIESALGSVICPLISNLSGKLTNAASEIKDKAMGSSSEGGLIPSLS
jgi:hypothetical protein